MTNIKTIIRHIQIFIFKNISSKIWKCVLNRIIFDGIKLKVMATNVSLQLNFSIPASEVMDVNKNDLIEWLKYNLGVIAEMKGGNQFWYYEFSEFTPKINDIKINGISQ